MQFGLTMEKLLLIGVIAVIIIGPERLPEVAKKFAEWVRRFGDMLQGAKSTIKAEMDEASGDIDWRSLDPRQYDPRRIIREALMDDPAPTPATTAVAPTPAAVAMPAARIVPTFFSTASPPPFDPEAT